jgi:hypothetical protein
MKASRHRSNIRDLKFAVNYQLKKKDSTAYNVDYFLDALIWNTYRLRRK